MHQSSNDDPIPASGEAGTMDVDDLASATDDERATKNWEDPLPKPAAVSFPTAQKPGFKHVRALRPRRLDLPDDAVGVVDLP